MCLCLYVNSSLRHTCRKQATHFCFKFVANCCFICAVLRFFSSNRACSHITLCLLYLVLEYWRKKYTKNGISTDSALPSAYTDSINGNLFLSSHLCVLGLGSNCGSSKCVFSLLLMILMLLMLLGLVFADLGPVKQLQF